MGIRFSCPNGHKLNVKESLAGKRAICPNCGAKVQIPDVSETSAAAVAPATVGVIPATTAGIAPSPAMMDSASPSVVISLAESTVLGLPEAIPPALPQAPAPLASPIMPAPSLPESLVVPSQPAEAEPLSPDEQYQIRRERNRRNQILIALALLAIVIALGITLVWVLWHHPVLAPSEKKPLEKTGHIMLPRSFTDVAVEDSLRANPRS